MMHAAHRKFCKSLGGAALLLAASLAHSYAHAAEIAKRVVRARIAGIDVIAYPTAIKDVVTVMGSLPAGDVFATDNIALATLAGTMLDRGTLKLDKFAIAKQLDGVGARLAFSVGEQTVTVQARSLKADLPMLLKVMADELRHPAFSADEFAKAKIEIEGSLRQRAESTEYRAAEAFSRAAFPAGHPNRPSSLDEWRSAVGKAALPDVVEFHRRHYGPSHMVLVLVGDLDIPKIQAEIRKDFGGWAGGVPYRLAAEPAVSGAPLDQLVSIAGKTSVTVLAGQTTGLRYRDPDSLPLRMGVAILGSGFTSRLLGTVRDKEGLTYHIGATVADDTFNDGVWRIDASFAPALLDKGLASLQRELRAWWQDGVSADEVKARKTDMIGGFQVSLSTTGGMAGMLLRTVERGYPLTWIDEYPKTVDALSAEQVNGAIRRYVDPGKLLIVKAGSVNADAAKPP
jgi:zinc protease